MTTAPTPPPAPPTISLMAELRSLPRAYWVLVLGWFINRLGTFVFPLLTLLLSGHGHGPTQVAWVLCGYSVGQFAANLFGGYFSDRFGRKHALVIGTMGHAAATLVLFVALLHTHQWWLLAILMACMGLGSGFYMPASNALLADVVPPPLRLRAYSAQRLAINAGFACGASMAAFLATWAVFVGDALTTAAFGVIALLFLPHGLRASREDASWAEAWKVMKRDGAFWALGVTTMLTSFLFQQFNSTFSLEVIQRGQGLHFLGWQFTPIQVFGLILGWNGVLVTICELPLTRWIQRYGSRPVIMLGYFLLGGGLALNALPGGVGVMFVGMTIFTIGEMLSQPTRSAYIAELAPTMMRGRYMGAMGMAGTFAGIFGPHVSLPLHAWSPRALWLGCGALGVISVLVLAFVGREKQP